VTDDLVGKQKHIKDLVSQSAMHVLDNGGTVRGFKYWGTRTLPQRMKRHTQFFNYGECVPSFPSPPDLFRVPQEFSRFTHTLPLNAPEISDHTVSE